MRRIVRLVFAVLISLLIFAVIFGKRDSFVLLPTTPDRFWFTAGGIAFLYFWFGLPGVDQEFKELLRWKRKTSPLQPPPLWTPTVIIKYVFGWVWAAVLAILVFGVPSVFLIGLLGPWSFLVGLLTLVWFSDPILGRIPAWPQPPEYMQRVEGPHGDAGWAKLQEVIDHGLITTAPNAIYIGHYTDNYGPVDNWRRQTTEQLGYAGEANIITFGPTRTGKGTTAIIPTLLTNAESCFVLDVKGENYEKTHAFRRDQLGHNVIAFDPFNVVGQGGTAGFNPLARCIARDGNFPNTFATDLMDLADALITTDNAQDRFWTDSARDLITCIMGHLCETRTETPTLGRVRQVLGMNDEDRKKFLEKCYQSHVPMIRDSAQRYMPRGGEDKVVNGIIQTAISQLNYLVEPRVVNTLARSTFQFEDLRTRPTTIYFIIPARELQTYYRFARMMVQSFVTAMSQPPPRGTRSVLAILDEQAQLGYMRSLEQGVALLCGYKVRIWSIFQNLGQLQSLYEKGADSFLGNAELQQFFTTNDHATAEYLSRRVGKQTFRTTSTTRGQSQGGHQGVSTTESTSESWDHGEFITPQALFGADISMGVILKTGLKYPVLYQKIPYYDHPVLKHRAGRSRFDP